eukprot:jgi/Tetstr1/432251/TSEL_002286.t1
MIGYARVAAAARGAVARAALGWHSGPWLAAPRAAASRPGGTCPHGRAGAWAGAALRWRGGVAARDGSPGRLLVVQPGASPRSPAALQEALRLAESLEGEQCPHVTVGSHAVRSATFLGKGSVARVAALADTVGAGRVFVNAELSGAAWKRTVIDRVALIINIFAARALTREARLQVELAELQLRASRLVRGRDASGERTTFAGGVEVVSARERGRGSSSAGGLGGAAGGGESELRLQRQRIVRQRKALQQKLREVQRTRGLQRSSRKRAGFVTAAVVGYTNAGKSSLVSALSRRRAVAEDRLFATLDPLLARCRLPSGRRLILSDTVGFVNDLPHQLVDAFRATLEEVVEAEVLIHVIDASSPAALEQREAVLRVLRELGLSDESMNGRMIEVWNKVDVLLPRNGSPGALHTGGSHLQSEPHAAGEAQEESSEALLEQLHRRFAAATESSPVRPAQLLASVTHRIGLEDLKLQLDDQLERVAVAAERQHEGHQERLAELLSPEGL